MINGNNTGNLYADSSTARVAAYKQSKLEKIYGKISMQSAMAMSSLGRQEEVMHTIGSELGINKADGQNNTSFQHYITEDNDNNNYLFQGADGDLYNINFTTGTYGSQSVSDFVNENYGGLVNPENPGDKAYDLVEFNQGSAQFVNYAFNGTGDGEFSTSTSLEAFRTNKGSTNWGAGLTWKYQEVNLSSSTSAQRFYNNITHYSNQWLNHIALADINSAEDYQDYLNRLFAHALRVMSANDESGSGIASVLA